MYFEMPGISAGFNADGDIELRQFRYGEDIAEVRITTEQVDIVIDWLSRMKAAISDGTAKDEIDAVRRKEGLPEL